MFLAMKVQYLPPCDSLAIIVLLFVTLRMFLTIQPQLMRCCSGSCDVPRGKCTRVTSMLL